MMSYKANWLKAKPCENRHSTFGMTSYRISTASSANAQRRLTPQDPEMGIQDQPRGNIHRGTNADRSIMTTTSGLARDLLRRMADAEVSSKGIVAAESLLFCAEMTANFLLAGVVYSVLVSREIVRPREDSIARLSSRWIDSFALVRTKL